MDKTRGRVFLILLAWLVLGLVPLPVRGSESRERVLTIRSQTPGSQYRIYPAADLLDVLFGVEELSAEPTAGEIAKYAVEKNLAAVLGTDEAGQVAWSLSKAGWPDGVYLVVEESGTEAPFYACVPAPDPDGEGWLYQVEAAPGLQHQPPGMEITLAETEPGLWHEGTAFCAAALGAAAVMVPAWRKKRPKTNVIAGNTQK